MRKKPTRIRSYFKMESAMTAILRDASGKMHHGYYSIVVWGLPESGIPEGSGGSFC